MTLCGRCARRDGGESTQQETLAYRAGASLWGPSDVRWVGKPPAVPSGRQAGRTNCRLSGVLLLAEEGVVHRARGIVHRDQQRKRLCPVPQPRVMTAVHLDQHALPGHALAAYPVPGLAPAPRTAQPGVDQDAPPGGPADVDAVALAPGPLLESFDAENVPICPGYGPGRGSAARERDCRQKMRV